MRLGLKILREPGPSSDFPVSSFEVNVTIPHICGQNLLVLLSLCLRMFNVSDTSYLEICDSIVQNNLTLSTYTCCARGTEMAAL